MRLLRLKVDGFGPLRGEYPFNRGRVTLVVDRNETGKSSLLAAISAALYGLEDDRRSHKVITPVDRWRPWDGGSYRVELELECEGDVYTVKRDFERGTVEVWDDRGLEVTASFREGKEDFPVGKKLLGLDAEEFEKCALVRQGELDQVVPGDEKARRNGTLQARLESAADTRGGDTSAAETLQVLQGALRKYNTDEVGFTGTVENAISRLELKRETLASELKTLEHDRLQVAGPLEELARLGAEEQAAREAIARLEAERRAAVTGDLARRLGEHRERREALAQLQAEAETLAPYGHLPVNAEADLRETIAKHEAAQKNLAAREARRQEEQARRRGELEATLATLQAYEACGVEDADRLVALAADLRRLAEEEERRRGEVEGLRDTLSGRGYEPSRVETLTGRFGALEEAQQKLLGGQSALALAFQTEIAGLEQARTGNTETLRQIDALRAGRKLPGWLVAALGVGAAIAGAVVLGIHGELRIGLALLGGGLVFGLLGVVLVALAEGARRGEREQALRQLTEAQRRINSLRTQRAESEVGLEELARTLRLPRRDRADARLERVPADAGGVEPGPARAGPGGRARGPAPRGAGRGARAPRAGGRRPAGAGPPRQRGRRHPPHGGGAAEPRGPREELVVGGRGEAARRGDRGRAARARGAHPAAGRALLRPGAAVERAREGAGRALAAARAPGAAHRGADPAGRAAPRARGRGRGPRSAARGARGRGGRPARDRSRRRRRGRALELDREVRSQREIIELVQRKRGDLRQQVDEVVRRAAVREPELLAEQARIEQALERARRFKRVRRAGRDHHPGGGARDPPALGRLPQPARGRAAGGDGRAGGPGALRRGPRLLAAAARRPAVGARQGAAPALDRRARPAPPGRAARHQRVPLEARRTRCRCCSTTCSRTATTSARAPACACWPRRSRATTRSS